MNATQAPLSATAAVLIGLIVLAVVAFEATWLILRYVMVMAHEGAHAVASSLLFRGVQGIAMNRKAEGLTTSARGGGCLGTIIFLFVGYIGPSLFGLGAASLITGG